MKIKKLDKSGKILRTSKKPLTYILARQWGKVIKFFGGLWLRDKFYALFFPCKIYFYSTINAQIRIKDCLRKIEKYIMDYLPAPAGSLEF